MLCLDSHRDPIQNKQLQNAWIMVGVKALIFVRLLSCTDGLLADSPVPLRDVSDSKAGLQLQWSLARLSIGRTTRPISMGGAGTRILGTRGQFPAVLAGAAGPLTGTACLHAAISSGRHPVASERGVLQVPGRFWISRGRFQLHKPLCFVATV